MAVFSRLAVSAVIAAICGLLSSRSMAQAAVPPRSLPAFNTVRVCVPFNVLISPAANANNQYQLLLDADAPVQQALQATVANNVLSLGVSGNFETTQPIKLTVQLPASSLTTVEVKSATAAQVVVARGFTPASFTGSNPGVSSLIVDGITTPKATLQSAGTGDIILRGKLGTVNVSSSGTGRVFISGVTQAVSANLDALGSVVIDAASDDVKISGSCGPGRVPFGSALFYNHGTCSVQSHWSIFSSPCQQTNVSIPSITPEWTCGLKLSGTFNCSVSSGEIVGSSGSSTYVSNGPGRVQSTNTGNGGSSAYSSVGGGGGFASGFSSSGSPGGSFGQTVTNVGGRQTVQTSTGFGDGSVRCTASARARSMT